MEQSIKIFLALLFSLFLHIEILQFRFEAGNFQYSRNDVTEIGLVQLAAPQKVTSPAKSRVTKSQTQNKDTGPPVPRVEKTTTLKTRLQSLVLTEGAVLLSQKITNKSVSNAGREQAQQPTKLDSSISSASDENTEAVTEATVSHNQNQPIAKRASVSSYDKGEIVVERGGGAVAEEPGTPVKNSVIQVRLDQSDQDLDVGDIPTTASSTNYIVEGGMADQREIHRLESKQEEFVSELRTDGSSLHESAVASEEVVSRKTPPTSSDPSSQKAKTGKLEVQKAIPRYEINPRPVYPDIALRKGWEGVVLLRVDVKKDGLVGRVKVEQSSGFKALDRAALKAVRRWQFAPAMSAGLPVAGGAMVPINFDLP